jgi:hypothetical protein
LAATSFTYSGNGILRDFAIGFAYTSRTFVKVYVGGVITTDWSFLNATTVRITIAPPVGINNVEIRRVTSTIPLVDFTSAATITDTNLDLVNLQTFHVLEENQNNSVIGMQQASGNWDATSDRITNLAAPLASTDGATKGYVDSITGSASAAAASAAAAAISANDALIQAITATNAQGQATGYAAAAASSAASIANSIPVSGLTANEVPVAINATTYDSIPVLLRKRLLTGSVAAVAQLDLALDSAYSEYFLVLEEFQPAADDNLQIRFSIDSGATYKAGASDYNYTFQARNSAAGTGPGSDSLTATFIPLARNVESTRVSRRVMVSIFAGNGSTLNQSLLAEANYQDSGGGGNPQVCIGSTAGEMDGFATKATHVRIFFAANNITTMTYSLFGVIR